MVARCGPRMMAARRRRRDERRAPRRPRRATAAAGRRRRRRRRRGGGGGALAFLGIGRFVLGFGDSNVVYYEYSSTTSTTANGVGDDGKPKGDAALVFDADERAGAGRAERGSEDGRGGEEGGGGAVEAGAVGGGGGEAASALSRDFFF